MSNEDIHGGKRERPLIVTEGADQAVWAQHWSFGKVRLANELLSRKGFNVVSIHGVHDDALGRNPNRSKNAVGLDVINEHYTAKHEPGWFAAIEALPAFGMHVLNPAFFDDFLGAKFRVATEQMYILLHHDFTELERILKDCGLPDTVPKTVSDFYSHITAGRWLGAADDGSRSVSDYTSADVSEAKKKLLRYLVRETSQVLPAEHKKEPVRRARRLSELTKGITPEMKLPEAGRKVFESLQLLIPPEGDANSQTVEWMDTISQFELLSRESTLDSQGRNPFFMFDWYLAHKNIFERAFEEAAKNARSHQHMLQLDTKSGELPFWIIVDGKRSKLFLSENELRFADQKIPVATPLRDHRDVVAAIKSALPDITSLRLKPTALTQSMQWMGRSHYLLPAGSSNYMDQVDAVLRNVVHSPELTLKDLKGIVPLSRVRVHPHAIDALADDIKIRPEWYIRLLFTDEVSKEGFITGAQIKARWREIDATYQALLDGLRGKPLSEQARLLFPDVADVAAFINTLAEGEKINAEKNAAVKDLDGIERAAWERMQDPSQTPKEARLFTSIKLLKQATGKYTAGRSEELPDCFSSEEKQRIESIKETLQRHASIKNRQDQAKAILTYIVMVKIRGIEGGLDALRYWDQSPSLLTTYLLGGEEAVNGLLKSNSRAEIIVERPDLGDATQFGHTYEVGGSKVLVYEDRTGVFIDQLTQEQRDSLLQQFPDRRDGIVVLLPPQNESGDCTAIAVDASGNTTRIGPTEMSAIQEHYRQRYNLSQVNIETAEAI